MFKKHASFQQHIDNMSQAQKKSLLGLPLYALDWNKTSTCPPYCEWHVCPRNQHMPKKLVFKYKNNKMYVELKIE